MILSLCHLIYSQHERLPPTSSWLPSCVQSVEMTLKNNPGSLSTHILEGTLLMKKSEASTYSKDNKNVFFPRNS